MGDHRFFFSFKLPLSKEKNVTQNVIKPLGESLGLNYGGRFETVLRQVWKWPLTFRVDLGKRFEEGRCGKVIVFIMLSSGELTVEG